jgi:hypothetical protein
MFRVYLEKVRGFIIKVRQFIIQGWRSIKKESPVVMIIDGKPVHESAPRAQRILRRLRQSKPTAKAK